MGALLSRVWLIGRAVNIITNIGVQLQVQEVRIRLGRRFHIAGFFKGIMPKKNDAAQRRDWWPPFVGVALLLFIAIIFIVYLRSREDLIISIARGFFPGSPDEIVRKRGL